MNLIGASSETTGSNPALLGTSQVVGAVTSTIFPLVSAVASEFLLRSISYETKAGLSHSAAFGRMLMVFLTIYLLHRFSVYCFRFYKPDLKNLFCLTLMVVGSVFVIRFGCLISFSLSTYITATGGIGTIPPECFYFAIPFATGGLLLQSILGLQYGLVYAVALSFIVGMYFPENPVFSLFTLASTLVCCLSLSKFRSRSAFIKAGLNVSLVTFPFAVAFILKSSAFLTYPSLFALFSALFGGVACAFLASGVAPIVEYLGGYVTDMRLLEMATIDHPLLKELSVQAPGTWNHCMVMGMMVEAAADSIGANPVLVRVGAYFHDIGKIKKPVYFVENQGGGENKHDKLSTSMSALIIRTHVKDGIELARKYGLPRAIQEMIPQHHGTSRIEYFYDKARREAQESGIDPDSVDESLYRYPGPRPQTREAGILMLADGIEAAGRTLSDPSPDRIQGMVQKMINKVFSSGELDECDLTLRDLHNIAKAFSRVLSGIYHQRIAYAEPAEKVRVSETEREEGVAEKSGNEEDLESGSSSEKQKVSSEEKGTREPPQENLKRLGL